MDDFDLENILDSVDVNSLPVASAPASVVSSKASVASNSSDVTIALGDVDIDDLLEDVADSMLSNTSADTSSIGSPSKGAPARNVDDDIDDVSLGSHMHNKELSNWSAAIVSMPPELRSKWNTFFEEDSMASCNSRFQLSDAYTGNDRISAKKVFQDCVRKTLKRNGVPEMKINAVMSAILSDPMKYNALIASFKEELLAQHKTEIVRDIDYDTQKFPNLAAHYA
jgi:ribosomal protein L12E/L44/L45/RPP1/RPP2